MPAHTSFYETTKEACMRLQNTVVMYDGDPYYVLCIDNHKPDGVFRIYLDPILPDKPCVFRSVPGVPYNWYTEDGVTVGMKMDAWLDANPSTRIIRKKMNSPAFNKFRPFPLGMYHLGDSLYYLERAPARHPQQGLTEEMVWATCVSGVNVLGKASRTRSPDEPYGQSFYPVYKGLYPTLKEVLEALTDPDISNEGAAFHREWGVVRGPARTLFLVNKCSLVGLLPQPRDVSVALLPEYAYLRESVQELGLFNSVVTL